MGALWRYDFSDQLWSFFISDYQTHPTLPRIHQKHSFFEFSSNTKSSNLPMMYFHRIHIDSYTKDFDLKNCPSAAFQQSVRTVQWCLTKTRTWYLKYFSIGWFLCRITKKLNVSNGSIHKKIWWLIFSIQRKFGANTIVFGEMKEEWLIWWLNRTTQDCSFERFGRTFHGLKHQFWFRAELKRKLRNSGILKRNQIYFSRGSQL